MKSNVSASEMGEAFRLLEDVLKGVLVRECIGDEQAERIIGAFIAQLSGALHPSGAKVEGIAPYRTHEEAMLNSAKRVQRTMQEGIPDQRFRGVLSMPDIQRQMIEALNRMDEEGNSEEEALPQPTAEESTAFAAMIQRVFEDPCVRDPLDS